MQLQPAIRSLRTIEDMMRLQTERAQRQRQAVSEGLEEFVRMEEAKTKIAIRAITDSAGGLRTTA